MSDVTYVLVRLPLTDEQDQAFEGAVNAIEGTLEAGICAIGTPVPDSGLEAVISDVLRDIAELPDRTSPNDAPDMLIATHDELETILRTAASALIAARDAEIAELRARMETVERETGEACARICAEQRQYANHCGAMASDPNLTDEALATVYTTARPGTRSEPGNLWIVQGVITSPALTLVNAKTGESRVEVIGCLNAERYRPLRAVTHE